MTDTWVIWSDPGGGETGLAGLHDDRDSAQSPMESNLSSFMIHSSSVAWRLMGRSYLSRLIGILFEQERSARCLDWVHDRRRTIDMSVKVQLRRVGVIPVRMQPTTF